MSDKHKQRTYARNRAFSRRGREIIYESDSKYLLKLVIVFLLGMLWLRFDEPFQSHGFQLGALPVGFFVGLIMIRTLEPIQMNRKLWYSLLLVVTLIGFFFPIGIVV
jgi:hypothetical protein